MPEKIQTSLKNAISEVFETMFFLLPSALEEDDDSINEVEKKISVKIESSGSLSFYLWLTFSELMLRIIASSLFDREQAEFDDQELKDLACEAANMIGGAFLNHVDPDRQDKLSLPEILENTDQCGTPTFKCQLGVDGEAMIACMRYQE